MNHPLGPGFAEAKAKLAAKGQSVHPQSTLSYVDQPTGPGPIVVLEKVRDGEDPDYCVHGFVECIGCREMCWMGPATAKIVINKEAFGACQECAARMVEPGQQPFKHVDDHNHNRP